MLALAGGAAMVVGPLLKWKIGYGFDGQPVVERGIESVFGWVVILCGVAALASGGAGRLLPLAILPGLIGGAITGLAFLDVMAWQLSRTHPPRPDSAF